MWRLKFKFPPGTWYWCNPKPSSERLEIEQTAQPRKAKQHTSPKMRLLLLLLLSATWASATVCGGSYVGCFKDEAPAPGVPPVRVVGHLLRGPVANMSMALCATDCALHGYNYSGLTGHKGAYFCYCDCDENAAAPPTANASCAAPCAGAQDPDAPCGGDGVMAAYKIDLGAAGCKLPPSSICGGGGNLPAGPACSQAAAQQWTFCNTSADLSDRVTDLVNRISMAEAGSLLTARESPAIHRLGIPSFYWGTNAIHGVTVANSTTFPEPLNLGATFNRSVMRGAGRVIGREMRAWHNRCLLFVMTCVAYGH